MKRIEAVEKLLQGASTKSKRNTEGLFTMMGKSATRAHSRAGGGGSVSTNPQQVSGSEGRGSTAATSTVLTPVENGQQKRARNLPQLGAPP